MSAPATASPSVSDAATLKAALDAAQARADAAEHHSAILEAKSQLESSNLAVMQVDLAGFAVLMTIIVIYFSWRTTNEAKAEARNVAREEIKATRDELTTLHDAVEKARTEADRQMNEIKSLVGRVQQTESEGRDLLSRIRDHQSQANKARAAVELFSENQSAQARPGERPLKPEVTAALEAAAEEAKDTAQNRWSIDQFRSAILKAIFSDQDHQRGAALASDMMSRFANDPAALAFAVGSLGDASVARKDWPAALDHYQHSTELHHKAASAESSEALRIIHQCGYVLNEMNRTAEAEAVYRELLPLCEKVDGAEASGTLNTRHNLAHSVLEQGRAAEAEALFHELLPLRENTDGAEASITLRARHGLARAVLDQGRAADAEVLFGELLPLCEMVDGAEDSGTLVTRHDLAQAVLDQGRAVEAEALFRELVRVREKVEGAEASGTLITRHGLARAMLDQGRAAEAEVLFRELLPLCEKVDGAEDSGTLVTRHELARAVLNQKGRAAEAQAMFQELLPLIERIDGPEDSGTLVTRTYLADATLAAGDALEAERILAAIPDLANRQDWLPRRAANLAFVRGKVADAVGKTAVAARALAEARGLYENHFPAEYAPRRSFEQYMKSRQ